MPVLLCASASLRLVEVGYNLGPVRLLVWLLTLSSLLMAQRTILAIGAQA